MDILNKKVMHKLYGEGTVKEINGNLLTVEFASKTSRFIYPNAFEKDLTLSDSDSQKIIIKELEDKKADDEAKKAEEVAKKAAEDAAKAAVRSTGRKSKDRTSGFGANYHVEFLAKQPILTYGQVENEFGISIAGYGKGINPTKSSVVIISSVDPKKAGFVYHDHWTEDGEYIYSGEGKTGDQKLTKGNAAIANAAKDGKTIHLFVKFTPEEYYYQGEFTLVDYKLEDEKDENGNTRKEYKFRLKRNQKSI